MGEGNVTFPIKCVLYTIIFTETARPLVRIIVARMRQIN